MDMQRDLFNWQEQHQRDLEAKHLARRTDPDTSKLVASDIAREGTVGRLHQLVIDTVAKHPNKTAREISDIAGVDNLHKRVAELVRRQLLRVTGYRQCTVSGRMAQTYFINRD